MRRSEPAITTIADLASVLREASDTPRRRRRPVALDLRGLDAVLAIDEVSGVVHVEVGSTVGKVEDALLRAGLTMRQDPPLHPNATIAEVLPLLRDALCGMEAVLPDGRALRIRPAPRRAVGPDLLALAAADGPRLFVPCAVYLRVRRIGDTPWVRFWRSTTLSHGVQTLQAVLRRGLRPFALELRAPARGACEGRIEVNAPVQVRSATEAILQEELARAEGAFVDDPGWPEAMDATDCWLPYAELVPAHARARIAGRIVRCDPVGAELRFPKVPARGPRGRGPNAAFEGLLERLKERSDPKGVLP